MTLMKWLLLASLIFCGVQAYRLKQSLARFDQQRQASNRELHEALDRRQELMRQWAEEQKTYIDRQKALVEKVTEETP